VSPLKIKIPSKNMREKPTNTPIIHSVYYVWQLLRVSALHCDLQGAFLVPSERFSIAWPSQIATHHVTKHNTPIHNILSTDPELSISQKALGTLPEDGNVMPKHVGATIHNNLNEYLVYFLFFTHICTGDFNF
jgi:hypothetical protein